MKEVVRKEILKLLEAGIIYPVADSQWSSPVHCVPKKGGITVVPNDKLGGGSTNINVNIDASGSSVQGDAQQSKELGRAISAAIQSELLKQKRPGGLLT